MGLPGLNLRLARLLGVSKVVSMKNPGLLVGGVLSLLAFQLSAQVTVEVTLGQDQFLPGESLPVAARIVNRSGQTLRMGDTEGWLTFSVESREGSIVVKTGDAPVKGEFTLQSSERATRRVDLAPYFNLGRPGRYTIRATVVIKEWNQTITSAPKSFDVVEGAKLWEQEVGLPELPGVTNQQPEICKYTSLAASTGIENVSSHEANSRTPLSAKAIGTKVAGDTFCRPRELAMTRKIDSTAVAMTIAGSVVTSRFAR